VRVEKIRETYDVDIQTVHFPLHPDTPMEGKSLAELFAGRGVDLDAMYQRMKGLMDAEGLPYAKRTHTYNSRLAQEIGKWADTQPGGVTIHIKLYQAYFVDNKNIGDIDLLVEIAESVGLDGAAARDVLGNRTFKAAIDADWEKSRQYGVTGVPTYVADGKGVVGAQPYEVLVQLMDVVGAAKSGG
jgi:predicted DsbA family dithiol-disulfide isomerase